MKSLFLLFSIFLSLPCFALPDAFFRSLRSPEIHIYDYKDSQTLGAEASNVPSLLQDLRNSKIAWSPKSNLELSDSCNPMVQLKATPSPQEARDFFLKCESQYRNFGNSVLSDSSKMLGISYPLLTSPFGRSTHFRLKSGTLARGQLLLKGNVQRPLIVLRMGVYSSLQGSAAELFLAMALFDEGPFHVLVLPSLTGANFIQDNSDFAYGGFEEGIQNLEILRLLQNPAQPISQLFSEFYTVGVSMGGHGMLFTNLLASQSQEVKISKSLLLCPLTDFQKTKLNNSNIIAKSLAMNAWSAKRLKTLTDKYASFLPQEADLLTFQFQQLFSYFENKYTEPLVGWPAEINPHLVPQQRTFELLNNYLDWWTSPLTVPTLTLYSSTDPLVPPQLNSESIHTYPATSNLAIAKSPKGLHCSLPASYDWGFLSSFLRSYFNEKALPQEVSWSQAFSGAFAKDLKNTHFQIDSLKSDVKNQRVLVDLSLIKNHYLCQKYFRNLHGLCKKQSFQLQIPTSAFDFHWEEDLEISEPILQRWLSTHLQLREQPDGFWLTLFKN